MSVVDCLFKFVYEYITLDTCFIFKCFEIVQLIDYLYSFSYWSTLGNQVFVVGLLLNCAYKYMSLENSGYL